MYLILSPAKWRQSCPGVYELTHWGRVTHICVGNLTITGSDNGLSPDRRQAIIWTNAGILLIGPLWTNVEIPIFSFKKMRLKESSAKWRPCCLGLNVLTSMVVGQGPPWIDKLSVLTAFWEGLFQVKWHICKLVTHFHHCPSIITFHVFYLIVRLGSTHVNGTVRLEHTWWRHDMEHTMTSSHGTAFSITGPLWGESTDYQWISSQRTSNAELWCSLRCYHKLEAV